MNIVKRWLVFTQERFPPLVQIPMVFLFVAVNLHAGNYFLSREWSYPQFSVLAILGLCFFFRLRCFDEIKDYAVDCVVNPTRPLARGLLSVDQVKTMIAFLILIECGLVAYFCKNSAAAYLFPLAYSFLMYEEFFISRWLAPKLTCYAVTHTFVASLLGLALALLPQNDFKMELWQKGLTLSLFNWFQFNIFEFARKTFASSEEKKNHDSYSSLYRPIGAVALTFSQVGLTAVLLSNIQSETVFLSYLLVAAVYAIFGVGFVVKPTVFMARAYRTSSTIYLVIAYAIIFLR